MLNSLHIKIGVNLKPDGKPTNKKSPTPSYNNNTAAASPPSAPSPRRNNKTTTDKNYKLDLRTTFFIKPSNPNHVISLDTLCFLLGIREVRD
jgi:hypothetical protein